MPDTHTHISMDRYCKIWPTGVWKRNSGNWILKLQESVTKLYAASLTHPIKSNTINQIIWFALRLVASRYYYFIKTNLCNILFSYIAKSWQCATMNFTPRFTIRSSHIFLLTNELKKIIQKHKKINTNMNRSEELNNDNGRHTRTHTHTHTPHIHHTYARRGLIPLYKSSSQIFSIKKHYFYCTLHRTCTCTYSTHSIHKSKH